MSASSGADGGIVIAPASLLDPEVQRLVEEVQSFYVTIYGGRDDSPVDAAEFEPPSGLLLLATVDGVGVAMGGWRLRADLAARYDGERVAEVKRMFVSPAARNRGHARLVLARLESTAREAGVDRLVLETGTPQQEAISLYVSSGYEPTLRFGHYADSDVSRYYAKALGRVRGGSPGSAP
jgi:GNAT superfamily N-acetyltransferase